MRVLGQNQKGLTKEDKNQGILKSRRNYSMSTVLVRGSPNWINLLFNKNEEHQQMKLETCSYFLFPSVVIEDQL